MRERQSNIIFNVGSDGPRSCNTSKTYGGGRVRGPWVAEAMNEVMVVKPEKDK